MGNATDRTTVGISPPIALKMSQNVCNGSNGAYRREGMARGIVKRSPNASTSDSGTDQLCMTRTEYQNVCNGSNRTDRREGCEQELSKEAQRFPQVIVVLTGFAEYQNVCNGSNRTARGIVERFPRVIVALTGFI
jgi:hypothetical protein